MAGIGYRVVERTRTRCPKGYRLIVRKSTYANELHDKMPALQITLLKNNIEVGYVDLHFTCEGFWESHSWLDYDERNNGLGILLYTKAIKVVLNKGEYIASSISPSGDAIRVWESRRLNREFKISRSNDRFWVSKCHKKMS